MTMGQRCPWVAQPTRETSGTCTCSIPRSTRIARAPGGITTNAGVVDIANASSDDLMKAGLVGYWKAQYDPNGVVNNSVDQTAVAISTNTALASLAPLTGHEFEGTSLYINGYAMPLTLVTAAAFPPSMPGYSARIIASQLQRRIIQAGRNQHLEHDPPALPDHR